MRLRRHVWGALLGGVLAALGSGPVFAQTYAIPWYTVDGGGGGSSGGTYTLTGTIGQPDASGALTGGTYQVVGGFWGVSLPGTTTTLEASPNPSVYGEGVTFTATVAPPGSTGSVSFRDGTTLLGSGTVSGGVALLTTSSLAVGTRAITASYGGDATHEASTSSVLYQVVNLDRLLSIGDATLTEGNAGTATASFTVTLSPASSQGVTTAYATSDLTATAGADYAAASGTLTFTAGATTRTVGVNVIGDTTDEPNEMFRVSLSSPVNAALGRAEGFGKIVDDDGAGGPTSASPVELVHGLTLVRSLASLPGPAQEQHFLLLEQKPYSSYELVVDEISGDLQALPAQPLAVDLLAADGTTVVRSAEAATGLGHSRTLRLSNPGATAINLQRVRVRSGGCTTGCGAEDKYRIRFYETTVAVPRFNNVGTQMTVLLLQNPSGERISGRVLFWSAAGTLVAGSDFAVEAKSTHVLNTSTVAGTAGQSGAITILHDGPYGVLTGKTVALEPATGFSFDSPVIPRP